MYLVKKKARAEENMSHETIHRGWGDNKDNNLYFDEYTNILKGMYITRFKWRPADREASAQAHSVQRVPTPPFIIVSTLSVALRPNEKDLERF